jgi:hypothetical protein
VLVVSVVVVPVAVVPVTVVDSSSLPDEDDESELEDMNRLYNLHH